MEKENTLCEKNKKNPTINKINKETVPTLYNKICDGLLVMVGNNRKRSVRYTKRISVGGKIT